MPTPLKHSAVIKAWADGAAIQFRFLKTDNWTDTPDPDWDLHTEYRVKPQKLRFRLAVHNGNIVAITERVMDLGGAPTCAVVNGREPWKYLTDWIEADDIR